MNAKVESRPVIGIAGLGYVGLATGVAFAAHGLRVFGFDVKPEVRAAVARSSVPFQEEGLQELLKSQIRSGRLKVVHSYAELVQRAHAIFVCVPTPGLRSGRIDLRPLQGCAGQLGVTLRSVSSYRLVVIKSTVVPGTSELTARQIRRVARRPARWIGVASNPEFLAEGTMVRDALSPVRIVLGVSDPRSLILLRRIYRSFHAPTFILSPSGAELVKYSANSFLALKVSFANEVSRLADRLHVSVDKVMAAVGHDPRIGERFLRAGPGFGGSCFDKDLRALIFRAKELGTQFRAGEAALRINLEQVAYSTEVIRRAVGGLARKQLALLGLAFKAGTDDVRESRAFLLARELIECGASIHAHDPVANANFRRVWKETNSGGEGRFVVHDSVESALEGADAAILHTDWPFYIKWRSTWTKRMKTPLLIDLRRAVNPRLARRSGLTLVGLGAGTSGNPNSGSNRGGP